MEKGVLLSYYCLKERKIDVESKTRYVLIADDRENWRRVLRYLSEREGFFVSEAKDVQEAKNILVQKKFDLALIDVRFIDRDIFNVDGLDLLRFVKMNYPETKTVVLTAYPESIESRKLKEADDFILKAPPKGINFNEEFRRKIRILLS